jgi:signal transduction histidine kinase
VDERLGLEDAIWGIVFGGAVSLIAHTLRQRGRRAAEFEERAALLEHEREETERAAVVEERRRIARELHDVIAHSVTLMTVQAGAARLLLAEDPERAREPVLSVEETGRRALAELRRMLGILRSDEAEASLAPQPGLARIDDLLAQARRAGLPVELAIAGETRVLPPGVDLAAYRIVQEALTNAHRHAGPAHAQVFLRYGSEALELEVTTDGRDAANGADRGGHGLVGMRERVALYDGTFEAGPSADGGYVVRARLPVAVSER